MLNRDSLTGLPARAACLAETSRRIVSGMGFTLLLADLDSLKVVNGSHSHRRGDWLIQRVGQATGALDPLAGVFRFGGDEFVVLLSTCDLREATRFGDRIRAAVSSIDLLDSGDPVEPDDPPSWHLDCSIGIAQWPEDARTTDDLIAAADRALYVAKHGGGGRVATTADVSRGLPRGSALPDG